jgi:GT2 family glycosyltransferase
MISIIIVTWNSEHEIHRCLGSIYGTGLENELEVIVVDNNSADNTCSIIQNNFQNVKLIKNHHNFGFTIGCNQGIKASKEKFVYLLNPDTEVNKDSLVRLKEFLEENAEVGAVAPQLLNEDGSIQYSCRTFPRYWDMFCELTLLSTIFSKSKTFARWKMKYFNHNELKEVDQPMAAALLIRKNILDKVDNMDERFQMFFNDVDLCKKIKDNNYKIIFNPHAKIKHAKGVSIYKDRARMIEVWNNDCIKYFEKYYNSAVKLGFLKLGLRLSGFFRTLFIKNKN